MPTIFLTAKFIRIGVRCTFVDRMPLQSINVHVFLAN